MMNVDMDIKATNCAAVVVAEHDLLLDVFPFSAVPVSIQVGQLGVIRCQAMPIAIVPRLYLTRKPIDSPAAMGASSSDFIHSARLRRHSLPFDIARAFSASCLRLAEPFTKATPTNRASAHILSSAIVAVILSAMLVAANVFVLLRRVFFARYYLFTPASTVNNLIVIGNCHKTIIHA